MVIIVSFYSPCIIKWCYYLKDSEFKVILYSEFVEYILHISNVMVPVIVSLCYLHINTIEMFSNWLDLVHRL